MFRLEKLTVICVAALIAFSSTAQAGIFRRGRGKCHQSRASAMYRAYPQGAPVNGPCDNRFCARSIIAEYPDFGYSTYLCTDCAPGGNDFYWDAAIAHSTTTTPCVHPCDNAACEEREWGWKHESPHKSKKDHHVKSKLKGEGAIATASAAPAKAVKKDSSAELYSPNDMTKEDPMGLLVKVKGEAVVLQIWAIKHKDKDYEGYVGHEVKTAIVPDSEATVKNADKDKKVWVVEYKKNRYTVILLKK